MKLDELISGRINKDLNYHDFLTNKTYAENHLLGNFAKFRCDEETVGLSWYHMLCRIDEYRFHESYFQNANGLYLQIFCRDDQYIDICNSIASYSRGDISSDKKLKQRSFLYSHVNNSSHIVNGKNGERYDIEAVNRMKNNIWIDTKNNWIAFFDAGDRVLMFNQILNNNSSHFHKEMSKLLRFLQPACMSEIETAESDNYQDIIKRVEAAIDKLATAFGIGNIPPSYRGPSPEDKDITRGRHEL